MMEFWANHGGITLLVIFGLMLLVGFLAACVATGNEFERKLGRTIRWGELFLILLVVMVIPEAGFLMAFYVWVVMPEPINKLQQ